MKFEMKILISCLWFIIVFINSVFSISALECGGLFEIVTEDEYFDDKIFFSFETNYSNFEIEYWIEDFNEHIVKSKFNTTNTNTKQYTPKNNNNNNYTIKANLSMDNCSIFKTRTVYRDSYINENSIDNSNESNNSENNNSNNLDGNNFLNNSINITINDTNILNESGINTDESNNSNYSNLTNNNNCNYFFNINLEQNITTNKIKFSFFTNVSNPLIEYWIEDFNGNIVKSKFNTTNTNTKQYTPKDKTELYFIKAKIYYQNCIINASKLAIYYSNTITNDDDEDKDENDESNNKNKEPYIKILDIEKLINKNILSYEVYRGDSSKRAIYIHLNSKQINSFHLEKHSKITGNLLINPKDKENVITISGLDLEENYTFNINNGKNNENNMSNRNNTNNVSQIIKKEEQKINTLNILNQKTKDNFFNFTLSSTLVNSSLFCYILVDRTKVSNSINLSLNGYFQDNFSLKIDNLLLKEKKQSNDNLYFLKLICKYQKKGTSYFNYKNYEFNYSILTKNISKNISKNKDNNIDTKLKKHTTKNNSLADSNSKKKDIENENELPNNLYAKIQNSDKVYLNDFSHSNVASQKAIILSDNKNNSKENTMYISQNYKNLDKSFLSIFLGTLSLLSLFIIRW